VIWHLLTKGEGYVWARPSLHAKKLRDFELKAGHFRDAPRARVGRWSSQPIGGRIDQCGCP